MAKSSDKHSANGGCIWSLPCPPLHKQLPEAVQCWTIKVLWRTVALKNYVGPQPDTKSSNSPNCRFFAKPHCTIGVRARCTTLTMLIYIGLLQITTVHYFIVSRKWVYLSHSSCTLKTLTHRITNTLEDNMTMVESFTLQVIKSLKHNSSLCSVIITF